MFVLLGLATVAFGLGSVVVRVRYGHLPVRARLMDTAAGPLPATVDLDKIAIFPWDRVFVVGPFTPREELRQRVAMPQVLLYGLRLEARDDTVVLIFAEGNKYSAHVPFPRAIADFAPSARPEPYRRPTARFLARRAARGHVEVVPAGP